MFSFKSTIYLDIVPMDEPDQEYHYLLVCVDLCTKYLLLRPLSGKSSLAEVLSLEMFKIFADFGIPSVVEANSNQISIVTRAVLYLKDKYNISNLNIYSRTLSPGQKMSQTSEDALRILTQWSDTVKSKHWAMGCCVVQQNINKTFTVDDPISPFVKVFAKKINENKCQQNSTAPSKTDNNQEYYTVTLKDIDKINKCLQLHSDVLQSCDPEMTAMNHHSIEKTTSIGTDLLTIDRAKRVVIDIENNLPQSAMKLDMISENPSRPKPVNEQISETINKTKQISEDITDNKSTLSDSNYMPTHFLNNIIHKTVMKELPSSYVHQRNPDTNQNKTFKIIEDEMYEPIAKQKAVEGKKADRVTNTFKNSLQQPVVSEKEIIKEKKRNRDKKVYKYINLNRKKNIHQPGTSFERYSGLDKLMETDQPREESKDDSNQSKKVSSDDLDWLIKCHECKIAIHYGVVCSKCNRKVHANCRSGDLCISCKLHYVILKLP